MAFWTRRDVRDAKTVLADADQAPRLFRRLETIESTLRDALDALKRAADAENVDKALRSMRAEVKKLERECKALEEHYDNRIAELHRALQSLQNSNAGKRRGSKRALQEDAVELLRQLAEAKAHQPANGQEDELQATGALAE